MDSIQPAQKSSGPTELQQVIRACDMCRKKKIRCEPTYDTCVQCVKYKTLCHFTPVSTKRKPRRPAGHKQVAELEERLKRMESLLKAVIRDGGVRKGMMLHESAFSSGNLDNDQNRKLGQMQVKDILSDTEPVWERTAPTCDSPISSLSISSRFGAPLGDSSQDPTMIYRPTMDLERASSMWEGTLVQDVFARRAFKELPPKSAALVLIDEALKSGDSAFPIFDHKSFMASVNEKYSESGPNDPGWWACINVVLCLAHRFRAMRTLQINIENGAACGYMQNALAVVSELTMQHNSLPAIQALLGMAIVLQGTPNPRLCSVLVAAAMRLCQAMGLHRQNRDLTLSEVETEQRKRVFWITYFLDKDISLRTGQPPAQDDDDMDIGLPSHTTSMLNLDGNYLESTDFFNRRIGLAIIQGQVYKRLYSAKAARQSEEEQLLAVHELDAMLAAWRSGVPIDFDEDTLTMLQPPICPAVIHKIILRYNYVYCLIIIHRPVPRDEGSSAPSDDLCVSEARKAIRLIEITPHGDYACVWLLIHFFFAAVTTILHNALRNPSHALTRSDLQLVKPFLGLLELLAQEGKSDEVQRMFEFCQELTAKATEAVKQVHSQMIYQGGKSRGEKESVEEFIWRVECVSQGCIGVEFAPPEGP